MKRISLICCMSMLVLSSLKSQIKLLFEGGVNYGRATIVDYDLSTQQELQHFNILSFYFSASPKYYINDLVAIYSEFQYSVEGNDIYSFISDQKFHNRIHYFRFIPGVEYNLWGPLDVVGGINTGYAVLNSFGGGPQISTFSSRNTGLSNFDFGLMAGINVDFSIVKFIVKYSHGLKDIRTINFVPTTSSSFFSQPKVRNRFLQIGIGYEFGL